MSTESNNTPVDPRVQVSFQTLALQTELLQYFRQKENLPY